MNAALRLGVVEEVWPVLLWLVFLTLEDEEDEEGEDCGANRIHHMIIM